jgi:hypothetical protein
MAGETTSTAEDRAIDALTRILDSAISPDMLAAQQIILRRLALSGDLFPSRIPAPGNITQVGGFLNLIAEDPLLTAQVLASALGVAGPNPSPGFDPVLPPLYFVDRPNDRPASVAMVTPITIAMRSDFVTAFAGMMELLHAVGCSLPVLASSRPLPPTSRSSPMPPDLLPFLGRTLDLVPTAALVDPTVDALAVGQLGGAGPTTVVARQLDGAAPSASTLTPASWSLWSCTSASCTQTAVTNSYQDLTPLFNAAGWYTAAPIAPPVSAASPGLWSHWINITGLVAGATTFGDELELLYSTGAIAASIVRSALDWVWNGTSFEQVT